MIRYLSLIVVATALLAALALGLNAPVEANGQGPNLLQPVETGGPSLDTGKVIVQFVPGVSRGARANLHAAVGGRVVDSIDALSMEVVELAGGGPATGAAVAAYSRSPLVVFAEPDAILPLADGLLVEPDDPYYADFIIPQWHHQNIHSPEAWAVTTGDSGLRLTICDTGVSASHPDLAANLLVNLGWNTASDNNDWSPVHFHGTAVAGSAAAVGNNGIGVVGVAWNAGIIPVRVTNRSNGGADTSDLAQCIVYGADNGSTAINVSYQTQINGEIDAVILAAAVYADTKGSVVVVAAGNANEDASPGQDPDAIFYVAATNAGDGKASFSNFGVAIDIAAPGEDILTTYSDVSCRGRNCTVVIDDYTWVSGTSFAAPIVAGAVLLAAKANAEHLASFSGSARAAELRRLLTEGACDAGVPGDDDIFGAGLLDVHAVVHNAACTVEIPAPSIISLQVTPIWPSVYVGGTQQFEALAFWSDGNLEPAPGGVIWSSTDLFGSTTTIASIDENAIATGESAGMAVIGAALDVGGTTVSGTTLFTVSEPPEAGTVVTVASIGYDTSGGKGGTRNLAITPLLVDDSGGLVSGASVTILLTNGIQMWQGTGTTGTDGAVTFTLKNAPSGTYFTTVTAVTAAELVWDGVSPPDDGFTK